MRRGLRPSAAATIAAALSLVAVLLTATPAAAITTTRAELDGSELRIEGEDATPNSTITVDGVALGSADGNGEFEIRESPFSSATCVVEVSDGVDTESVTLDGCTPSGPPPNLPPTAVAGADQSVTDADDDGTEVVTLDGSTSSDPEGPIASFAWTEGTSTLGTTATISPTLTVGTHTITLTVTDDDGATDADTVVVTVEAAVPPPPPPPGNEPPTADAGPDQTVVDADNSGSEIVTLDGSGSADADGTIVSFEWSENGVPLGDAGGGTGGGGGGPAPPGTFDHLFESNQPDPPGVNPNSFGGAAASAGDVNGDGFDDVIIGSELWDGDQFVEGAAFVFFGSANGPVGSNPSNAHARIEMNQAIATVNDVASAGDVNGDGFADVIVGSHFYESTLPGTQLAVDGAAFVFHGSAQGITATGPEQADASIFSNQLTSGMGDFVDSAGDVNGDGFDDIIVSVTREGVLFPPQIPPNDRSGNYGAMLIFHGGPQGITGTGFGDADAVILPYEDTGEPLPPVDAQVIMGRGAGDINGDGFDDIVVGGTEITVYLGGPNGITAQDVFDADDTIVGNPALGVSQSIGGVGGFFRVDGAGDINGDGFDDIVAALPGRTLDPLTVPVAEGAAYIFLGGPTGLGVTSVDQAHTSMFGTLSVEEVGFTVSGPGDVDNDGFDDVIVAASHYAGSLNMEGVAHLFRGSAQGISATSIEEADARLLASQSGATVLGNDRGFDAQGAGDVDGDGFADIIIGKAFYDNGEENEGAAFLHLGGTFPANPNTPPVAAAGADQTIVDEDLDGVITVTVDGTASFDSDGSIATYEWYQASTSGGTGEILKATGPTATFDLPFLSPIPAFGHLVTLVVTDDQGTRRGDTIAVFPRLPDTSFEFAEWADLSAWTTTGSVSIGDPGVPFPDPAHIQLDGTASLERTFTPTPGTTGLDISFWARGDGFIASDELTVQVSADGGPFVDAFTIGADDATGSYVFYGGSAFPISASWWPATASSVTLRFESNLSAGATAFLSTLRVDSIQAETGSAGSQPPIADGDPNGTTGGPTLNVDLAVGNHTITLTVTDDQGATATDTVEVRVNAPAGNQPPVADAGPDQTVGDTDNTGGELVTLDGSGSSDTEGPIAQYAWFDAGGVQIAAGATPDVPLDVGTHTITLTVTDGGGATGSDTVVVTVDPFDPSTNTPPAADAGPDQVVVDEDGDTLEVVTFDGSASVDPDGSIVSYQWTKNGNPFGNQATFSLTQPIGVHTVELTVTDNLGATATDTVVVTVEAAAPPPPPPPPSGSDVIHMSSSSGGTVGGVTFADEDVLAFDTATGEWAMVIDGSDIGLGGSGARDVDAVHRLDDGSFLLSITGPSTLPDVGSVDDSDIVRFVPTSTGSITAGSFELYVDASDVGLSTNGEDVDGVHVLADGDLLISTSGSASVSGTSGNDEDVLRFTPTSLGSTTAGTWAVYADGSDIGLSNSSDEDVSGLWLDETAGDLALTTRGAFAVSGLSGTGADAFACLGITSGGATSCSGFSLLFDGSANGFGAESADALFIAR